MQENQPFTVCVRLEKKKKKGLQATGLQTLLSWTLNAAGAQD